MSEILLSRRPRRDDPNGHISVQRNLEELTRLFERGASSSEVLKWDTTQSKWRPHVPVALGAGSSAGQVPVWDGSGWVAGQVDTVGIADGAITDVKHDVDSPVVTADTVANLGTTRDGKAGLLRIGSTPFDFVPLVYDGTYAKWVSPVWGSGSMNTAPFVEAGTAFGATTETNVDRAFIPNYDTVYAAGLRLQGRLMMLASHSTNGGAAEARLALYEFNVNDTAYGTALESLTHITALTGVANQRSFEVSNWLQFATNPTEEHAVVLTETRTVLSATSEFHSLMFHLRWVSA